MPSRDSSDDTNSDDTPATPASGTPADPDPAADRGVAVKDITADAWTESDINKIAEPLRGELIRSRIITVLTTKTDAETGLTASDLAMYTRLATDTLRPELDTLRKLGVVRCTTQADGTRQYHPYCLPVEDAPYLQTQALGAMQLETTVVEDPTGTQYVRLIQRHAPAPRLPPTDSPHPPPEAYEQESAVPALDVKADADADTAGTEAAADGDADADRDTASGSASSPPPRWQLAESETLVTPPAAAVRWAFAPMERVPGAVAETELPTPAAASAAPEVADMEPIVGVIFLPRESLDDVLQAMDRVDAAVTGNDPTAPDGETPFGAMLPAVHDDELDTIGETDGTADDGDDADSG